MKEKDLKELIDSVTSIGYEIIGIKPHSWTLGNEIKAHLTGAYQIDIAPIEECEKRRVTTAPRI